ncbi:aldehyde dehydrogenase family protein [Gammaproteobacteria bacterium]|nr:aldehyde dehydrogenase family protein [Gammaproteobacteria bacterium]MDC3398637.1 aldehyde dehydrogenase family protein [Gammaproteobacteria bacterium]
MAIFSISHSESGRKQLSLKSPVDLSHIDTYDCATSDDVSEVMTQAKIAQSKWKQTTLKERVELMHRVADVVIQQQDRIMDVVMRETGKPIQEAMAMEVFSAVDSLVFYAKRAEKWLSDKKIKMHGPMRFLKKTIITYKPRGVVAVITPWNGPFILSINPVIQAVLCGNSVIVKPSEVTPMSGALVQEIFALADAPMHLVQTLIGDGETGAELISQGPDKVSFTGSVATGKKIAAKCGEMLIPFSLELGGKDAMIVCSDADVKDAASGAVVGSFMNAGQYCCGTERIYVMSDIYDEFVAEVVSITKSLVQSNDCKGDVGPTFWDKQIDIIEDHVNDAIAKGATVLAGGKRNPAFEGLYFEPTVLTEVTHEMKIMKDETFGPVICIMKVNSEDEALSLANQSHYGLNGNVWTKDLVKGQNLARSIETGACSVNDMAMSYGVNEVPFGGVKNSGLGVVNGKEGLLGYAHAMPIIIGKKSASAYPYTDKSFEQLKGALKIFWGNRLVRKLFG